VYLVKRHRNLIKLLDEISTLDPHDNRDLSSLIHFTSHVDEDVRKEAVRALLDAPIDRVKACMISVLKDGDEFVVIEGLEIMGLQEEKSYLPEIIPYLDSDEVLVRHAAAFSLGCLGTSKAIPSLEAYVQKYPTEELLDAEVALYRLGHRWRLDNILRYLESENYHNRCGVANLVEFYIDDKNRDAVLKALKAALKKETFKGPKSDINKAIGVILAGAGL